MSNPLPISVVSSALGEDIRQSPRMARTMGFTGLQLPARSSRLDLTQQSESGLREIRHLCQSQDQQIVGLRADVGSRGLGPGADVDQILSQMSRILQTGKTLGAPLICVEVGPLPEPVREVPKAAPIDPGLAGLLIIPTSASPAPRAPSTPPPDPAVVSQVNAALDELGRLADRFSVMLAFRSELSSLAALESALRSVNCTWFGIDLDPVAIIRDEWEQDEAFSRIGPLVRHVRARDAVGGAGRRTKSTVIGRGDADWPRLLADLDAAGYHGWLTIDPLDLPDPFASANAGVQVLQKL